MEIKNIILIIIVILIVALVGAGIFLLNNGTSDINNLTGKVNLSDNSTNATVVNVTDSANGTNDTIVGDNSLRENATANGNNTTQYKVYNPQSDSYVPVIGEKYDDEVNRWYTYDTDGVRYYNTRIN